MSVIWSVVYASVIAAVAAAFQSGYLLAGDGFFLAASVLAVFSGHWVIAADSASDLPVANTRLAPVGAAYALSVALTGLVTVQALSQSV